jgi:hypothetical protein
MGDKGINEFLTEYLLHAKINALKSKIHLHNILYKIPILTSQGTRYLTVTNNNPSMLFRDIICVYYDRRSTNTQPVG